MPRSWKRWRSKPDSVLWYCMVLESWIRCPTTKQREESQKMTRFSATERLQKLQTLKIARQTLQSLQQMSLWSSQWEPDPQLRCIQIFEMVHGHNHEYKETLVSMYPSLHAELIANIMYESSTLPPNKSSPYTEADDQWKSGCNDS